MLSITTNAPGSPNSRRHTRRPLLRWDGKQRSLNEWTHLDHDPELWLESGNCLIYLHESLASISTPAFKLSFAQLLGKRCQPLIKRFIEFSGDRHEFTDALDEWDHIGQKRTIELYIAPRKSATSREMLQHRLAVRNLLAWVMDKPLVGEHLGTAMISLLQTMQLYRSRGADNSTDLTNYLMDQGYFVFNDSVSHSLAAMQLAEYCSMDDLYVRAFAHTAGMSDLAMTCSEYQQLSLRSRKLIRSASHQMIDRMERYSALLSDLLTEELSETNLGLPSQTRHYLDQFRVFLTGFYSKRFGKYPPSVFDARTLRIMCQDFAAMYDLLVDDGPASFGAVFSMTTGGTCTLQLIQAFEARHNFIPLDHISPLLPRTNAPQPSIRRLWTNRFERQRIPGGLAAHTALINASNWRDNTMNNDLVRAYRVFEGLDVQSNGKADNIDVMALAEARKARWLLIYTTYQVLRSATERPIQTEKDDTWYHLNVTLQGVPPWRQPLDLHEIRHNSMDTVMSVTDPYSQAEEVTESINVTPDTDYYTTFQETPTKITRRSSLMVATERTSHGVSRSKSITRALGRNGALRRSLKRSKTAIIKNETHGDISPVPSPKSSTWMRRFSSGFTVGLSERNVDTLATVVSPIVDIDSSTVSSQRDSQASTIESASSLNTSAVPSPASPGSEASAEWDESHFNTLPRNSSRRSLSQLTSTIGSVSRKGSIHGNRPQERPRRASDTAQHGGLSRPLSLRIPDLRRKSRGPSDNTISPVQVRELDISEISEDGWSIQDDTAEWNAMESFLDGDRSPVCVPGEGIMPAWEQYSDLGGLTRVC